MPLLDVFDEVPADLKVSGDIPDAHVAAQLQSITLEGVGVGPARISEAELHLAGNTTLVAAEALDGEFEIHRFAPDGQTPELSDLLATVDDILRPAERTPQVFWLVGDPEGDLAVSEKGSDMAVATQPPPMV
jgi:hypothetical protein